MFRCFVDFFGYCNRVKTGPVFTLKGRDGTEEYIAGSSCSENPKNCTEYMTHSQRYLTLATGKK